MKQDANQFYLLAESSPDAIFIGTQGRFVYVNPAAVRLFGAASAAQLLGQPVVERIHPDDRAAVAARIRQVYERKENVPALDETYLRLDGSPVAVEVEAVPFRYEGEDGGLVFVRDITARKKIDGELKRERKFLRQVIDASPNLIFVKERSGRFLLANAAVAQAYGARVEEIEGRTDADFNPNQEEVEAFLRADREVIDRQAPKLIPEEAVSFADGTVHWYSTTKTPIVEDDGSCDRVLGIAADVSALKHTQTELLQSQELLQSIIDNTTAVIFVKDLEGRYLLINRRYSELFHVSNEAMLGRTDADLFGSALEETLRAADRRVLAADAALEFEEVIPHDDGPHTYIALKFPLRDRAGKPYAVCGIATDITERRLVENEVRRLNQRLEQHVAERTVELVRANEELRLAASVFHNSAEGVMVTDVDAIIISVNPAFTEITGYTAAEAVGRKANLLRSDRQDPAFYRAMWDALGHAGRWQGDIWNRRKGGEAYLEWLTINRIDDAAGRPVRYVSVFHDITELRRKDERIRHLAFHDALTGLPNRVLMQDRLQHALERAKRDGDRLSVTFVDLDRFKAINDTFGHDVGDLLLQEVACRIRSRLRAMDTVARLGGDEFVILMENLEAAGDCACLAGELIAAISQPMELRGHTVEVGASMGMAFFPEDGDDHLELMKRADMAMYAAKAAGRNTYRFFQQEMLERTSERLTLEMDLRRAIASHDLELHYQPHVVLAGGQVRGVEALVRWRHPQRGLLPPADFIPLAEESGLILNLGTWVLDEACRQAALWRAQGRDLKVAVNVSARQLAEDDLVECVSVLAGRHGITPADLEIELTESAVMSDPERVAGTFTRLRELGVTIAVDDFGTGYSSLAYLRRLPIDVLKIDRSFVKDADWDEEDAQIVRTILALGRSLRLTVVAEGIETASQAQLLNELGCHLAQGYHYSRPLPAADLEAWLDEVAARHC